MKNNTLQQLLDKYQQGLLSSEEIEQLNQLTHKDEVMVAAEGRARTIIRRRTIRNVGFVCVGLALAGAGIWMFNSSPETPMLAEMDNAEVKTVEKIAAQDDINAVPIHQVPVVSRQIRPVMRQIAEPEETPVVEEIAANPTREEPTVVCNNQCDADSVINDIWKFLTA